jgi:Fe-S cluster assembly protein SufD
MQHIAPNCSSNEVFRGLVDDQANAVFNGRIHIHPNAQKTLAELSNKNLLLSSTATINTKPELEIYADDVRCSHGATVGQINSEALFYLQSRGIPRVEAKRLLSLAFIAEIVEQLPQSSVREFVTQRSSSLLSSLHHEGER